MEATRSSETSILTTATRSHIPEDDIHHSHRSENLKSYIYGMLPNEVTFVTLWARIREVLCSTVVTGAYPGFPSVPPGKR
jgi:hypothetical protein